MFTCTQCSIYNDDYTLTSNLCKLLSIYAFIMLIAYQKNRLMVILHLKL